MLTEAHMKAGRIGPLSETQVEITGIHFAFAKTHVKFGRIHAFAEAHVKIARVGAFFGRR